MDPLEFDQSKVLHRQIMVGIIASTKPEIAIKVYEQKILIKQLTDDYESIQGFDNEVKYSLLEHALAFWTCVSCEINVKKLLQQDRLPFKLYQLLRVKNN